MSSDGPGFAKTKPLILTHIPKSQGKHYRLVKKFPDICVSFNIVFAFTQLKLRN
jgi:hypothetical protein